MVLNSCQIKTVQEAIDWFRNSSEQIFEIDGEAGTGKSVVINSIVQALKLQPYQCMPMAYTGQAAIVMRMKGFPHARSIHSNLYELIRKPKEYKDSPFKNINTEFNTPEYEYEFRPREIGSISNDIKLMIIDEAYMVPAQMKANIVKHGIKILATGDTGQLPPIGGAPAFLIGYGVHHLDEIMRQSLNNPIVYLAHRARQGQPIH